MKMSSGNFIMVEVCIIYTMETFSELLTIHVIALQQKKGKIINQKQLAGLLEVGETTLNLAWNGKRPPSKKLVDKCAVFFSDMRFYDVAKMTRPDPRLHYINRHWNETPEDVQQKIADNIARPPVLY
jgi:hypothetical protein